MKKVRMRQDNARDKEQIERMRSLAKANDCFFCKDNYKKIGAGPEIYRSKHWYVKKNDYPYTGTVHHFLLVSSRHITKVSDIAPTAWSDLLKTIKWLKKHLRTKGECIFVRSDDMRYTGATLDHLHFQFLVGGPKKKNGKLEDNILVTLGHKSAT